MRTFLAAVAHCVCVCACVRLYMLTRRPRRQHRLFHRASPPLSGALSLSLALHALGRGYSLALLPARLPAVAGGCCGGSNGAVVADPAASAAAPAAAPAAANAAAATCAAARRFRFFLSDAVNCLCTCPSSDLSCTLPRSTKLYGFSVRFQMVVYRDISKSHSALCSLASSTSHNLLLSHRGCPAVASAACKLHSLEIVRLHSRLRGSWRNASEVHTPRHTVTLTRHETRGGLKLTL